ncbi:hypothetical protein VNO80_09840 [Phaseolus coccineus]|uniref:Uncharacterized protein n=1 Tax=Phaseolus coccineus TaxID=3886 RepID=A0AAN9NCA3_PHACN
MLQILKIGGSSTASSKRGSSSCKNFDNKLSTPSSTTFGRWTLHRSRIQLDKLTQPEKIEVIVKYVWKVLRAMQIETMKSKLRKFLELHNCEDKLGFVAMEEQSLECGGVSELHQEDIEEGIVVEVESVGELQRVEL